MTTSSTAMFLVGHLAVGALDLDLEDLLGAQDLGGAAAGDDGLELAAGLEAAADVENEFAERDGSGGHFEEAGLHDVAADAHGAGAAVAGRAHFGVFLGARDGGCASTWQMVSTLFTMVGFM